MKILRGAMAALLLAGALAPEFARYRAERMLRVAETAFSIVLTHPSEVADPAAKTALHQEFELFFGSHRGLRDSVGVHGFPILKTKSRR